MGVTNCLRSLRSLCQHAKDLFLWFHLFIYFSCAIFARLWWYSFCSFGPWAQSTAKSQNVDIFQSYFYILYSFYMLQSTRISQVDVPCFHVCFVSVRSSFLLIRNADRWYSMMILNLKVHQWFSLLSQLISCHFSAVANENSFDVKKVINLLID